MTTITARVARYVALPIASAGIIGATALGMAGIANAATVQPDPQPPNSPPQRPGEGLTLSAASRSGRK